MQLINYISLSDFCELYGLKLNSVRSGLKRQPDNWPSYLKVGRLIRFKSSDINDWEARMKR